MKAIVIREFGPPGVMQLEEVADPRPGPGGLGSAGVQAAKYLGARVIAASGRATRAAIVGDIDNI